tara:strand:- start:1662 stop:1976 length:315 start_codon:yes stop_codon:yes gene_type:complete
MKNITSEQILVGVANTGRPDEEDQLVFTHLSNQNGNGIYVDYRGMIYHPTQEQVRDILKPKKKRHDYCPLQTQMIDKVVLADQDMTLASLRDALKQNGVKHRIK